MNTTLHFNLMLLNIRAGIFSSKVRRRRRNRYYRGSRNRNAVRFGSIWRLDVLESLLNHDEWASSARLTARMCIGASQSKSLDLLLAAIMRRSNRVERSFRFERSFPVGHKRVRVSGGGRALEPLLRVQYSSLPLHFTLLYSTLLFFALFFSSLRVGNSS